MGDLATGVQFALPPVALGAALLLTPWAGAPTSRQIMAMRANAVAAATRWVKGSGSGLREAQSADHGVNTATAAATAEFAPGEGGGRLTGSGPLLLCGAEDKRGRAL
jgi:hypothetical protein